MGKLISLADKRRAQKPAKEPTVIFCATTANGGTLTVTECDGVHSLKVTGIDGEAGVALYFDAVWSAAVGQALLSDTCIQVDINRED